MKLESRSTNFGCYWEKRFYWHTVVYYEIRDKKYKFLLVLREEILLTHCSLLWDWSQEVQILVGTERRDFIDTMYFIMRLESRSTNFGWYWEKRFYWHNVVYMRLESRSTSFGWYWEKRSYWHTVVYYEIRAKRYNFC